MLYFTYFGEKSLALVLFGEKKAYYFDKKMCLYIYNLNLQKSSILNRRCYDVYIWFKSFVRIFAKKLFGLVVLSSLSIQVLHFIAIKIYVVNIQDFIR